MLTAEDIQQIGQIIRAYVDEQIVPHGLPGLLPDWRIRQRVHLPEGDPRKMVISPFAEQTKVDGKISWGLSSYGYDLRLGRKYLIFSDVLGMVVDPLTFRQEIEDRKRHHKYVEHEGDNCLIPPNSFVLAESLETLRIPRDVLAIVLGKSTYARCGIHLTMTPLEPEWLGIVTIEISNATRLPARVHSEQGIGQAIFLSGEPCEKSYADKQGASYQDQKGLTLPRA